jgi:predicted HTH domain antitoxin
LRFSKREVEAMFEIPGLECYILLVDWYCYIRSFATGYIEGKAKGYLSFLFNAVERHDFTAKEAYESAEKAVREYGESVRVALLAEMVDRRDITVQRAAELTRMTEDEFERAAKAYERDVCLAFIDDRAKRGGFASKIAEELRQATLKAYEIDDEGPSEA